MNTTTQEMNLPANNSHIDVVIKGAPANNNSFWYLTVTLDGAFLESIGFTPGKKFIIVPETNKLVFYLADTSTAQAPSSTNSLGNIITSSYFQNLFQPEIGYKEVSPVNDPGHTINPSYSLKLYPPEKEYKQVSSANDPDHTIRPSHSQKLYPLQTEDNGVGSVNDPGHTIDPSYFRNQYPPEKKDLSSRPNKVQETKNVKQASSDRPSPTELTSMQPQRQLKIRLKSVPRSKGAYQYVPEILLSGKYLEKFGFTVGKTVTILQEHGKFIITVNNPDLVTNSVTENGPMVRPQKKSAQVEGQESDPSLFDDLVNAAARQKEHIATRTAYKANLSRPNS